MGDNASQVMRAFAFVLLVAAARAEADADAYTVGQVAHGLTSGGVVTGVDYGHGVVSGVGAIGNRAVYAAAPAVHHVATPVVNHAVHTVATPAVYSGVHSGVYSGLSSVYGHYYGNREAEAEPYTVGQVYAGLPVANAYATGHAHNVGYTTNLGYSHVGYPYTHSYGYGYNGHFYG